MGYGSIKPSQLVYLPLYQHRNITQIPGTLTLISTLQHYPNFMYTYSNLNIATLHKSHVRLPLSQHCNVTQIPCTLTPISTLQHYTNSMLGLEYMKCTHNYSFKSRLHAYLTHYNSHYMATYISNCLLFRPIGPQPGCGEVT